MSEHKLKTPEFETADVVCAHCRFFNFHDDTCRRRAPTATPNDVDVDLFPIVSPIEDWCGEFEVNKEIDERAKEYAFVLVTIKRGTLGEFVGMHHEDAYSHIVKNCGWHFKKLDRFQDFTLQCLCDNGVLDNDSNGVFIKGKNFEKDFTRDAA